MIQPPCPLKKYMSTQTARTNVSAASNSSSSSTEVVLSGLHVHAKPVLEQAAEEYMSRLASWTASHINSSAVANSSRNTVEVEGQIDSIEANEDFLALPPTSLNTHVNSSNDNTTASEEALVAAQQRIAQLKEENARWEALCAKMQQHIQDQSANTKGSSSSANSTKVSNTNNSTSVVLVEDVGDAKEVVAEWQAADPKAKKRRQSDVQGNSTSSSNSNKKQNKKAKK
jgi:hypothetical protein